MMLLVLERWTTWQSLTVFDLICVPAPQSPFKKWHSSLRGHLVFLHWVHRQVDMAAVLRHLSRRGQPPAVDFQHEKYSAVSTVISFGKDVTISKYFYQNVFFFSDIQHSHKKECFDSTDSSLSWPACNAAIRVTWCILDKGYQISESDYDKPSELWVESKSRLVFSGLVKGILGNVGTHSEIRNCWYLQASDQNDMVFPALHVRLLWQKRWIRLEHFLTSELAEDVSV